MIDKTKNDAGYDANLTPISIEELLMRFIQGDWEAVVLKAKSENKTKDHYVQMFGRGVRPGNIENKLLHGFNRTTARSIPDSYLKSENWEYDKLSPLLQKSMDVKRYSDYQCRVERENNLQEEIKVKDEALYFANEEIIKLRELVKERNETIVGLENLLAVEKDACKDLYKRINTRNDSIKKLEQKLLAFGIKYQELQNKHIKKINECRALYVAANSKENKQWNGLPENKDKSGLHRLKVKNFDSVHLVKWCAELQGWGISAVSSDKIIEYYQYIGPV